MKTKHLISALIVIIGFAATHLFGQGRINFNNSSATPIRITDGVVTSVLGTASTAHFGIGPASVRIYLFAGLTSSSLSPVLIGTGADQPYVLNTASTLALAQGTFNGGSNLPLPGFDGSQPAFLQFQAISDGDFPFYFAMSPIIQVVPEASLLPAKPVFSPTADGSHWDGIINFLPEPTSATLLGLGLAAAGWARRRR
jgi:hypothetical protein